MFAILELNNNISIFIGFITIMTPVVLAYLKSIQTQCKVEELHTTFNSKMDRLLKLVEEAAYAKGKLAGAEESRQTAMNLVQKTAEELVESNK